jgi:hypothetical protein
MRGNVHKNGHKLDGFRPGRVASGTKEDHKNAATALQYCTHDGKSQLAAYLY